MSDAPINHQKWVPPARDIRGLIGAIASRCRDAGCTYQALGSIKPKIVLWPYPTKLPSTLDGFCTHPRILITKKGLLSVADEWQDWYLKAEGGVSASLLKDVNLIFGKEVHGAFELGSSADEFLVDLVLLLLPSCRSYTLDENNFFIRVGSSSRTAMIGIQNNHVLNRKVDTAGLTATLTKYETWQAPGFGLMERLWLWVAEHPVADKQSVLAALASLKLTGVGDWAVLLDEQTFGMLASAPDIDTRRVRKGRGRISGKAVPDYKKAVALAQTDTKYGIHDYDWIRGIMRATDPLASRFKAFHEYMVPSKVDEKRFRLMFGYSPKEYFTIPEEEKLWAKYVKFEKVLTHTLGMKK